MLVTQEKLLKTEIDLTKCRCDIEKLKEKLKEIAIELEHSTSNLEKSNNKLAQETVAKISLINELQTLKEELHFKESLYSKELSISNSSIHIEEVSLTAKLSELKKDFDVQLKSIEDSLSAVYVEKMTLLEQEKKAQEEVIAMKDREIINLKNCLQKYRTYSVSIEPELQTYKRLVEIGETSLHTTMESPGKFDEKAKSTTCGYDFVEIVEVDPNGAFIKIENIGNNPTDITGWRLIQTNQHEEETIFKFRRGIIIQPAGTITVWSNESGNMPSIPTDIVMKKNRWYSGNDIKTVLISSNSLEVSSFTIPKSSTEN